MSKIILRERVFRTSAAAIQSTIQRPVDEGEHGSWALKALKDLCGWSLRLVELEKTAGKDQRQLQCIT